jgi:UDP-glucose 4-epimerase
MGPTPDRKEMRAPVAVTGANGFVGGHLVETLRVAGLDVRPCARELLAQIDSLDNGTWGPLRGCAAVVHLAARAHVLEEHSDSAIAVYRQANRDLTLKLAQAAVAAGVGRFVFLSSIRVNGSSSSRPFRPEDAPRPEEPYAISKYEAELALWKIAQDTGLQVVIVRPPLIYGPGVKANFRRLLKLAALGLPLPLASVVSLRSLLGVRNLCDLLRVCLDHPAASGRTLLVSDGEDIALPTLIRELAAGMGRHARLFPVPVRILRILAACVGKGTTFDKLTASLQVDASATFAALDWRPPVPLRDGLRETARWFAESPR